ncbi:hypothetical protein P3F01_09310 [Clostridium perfringens]|uniref:2'-5' RNA ligase family protein n=1 Tax=Clostridium perfringens TaxID=1502 RepID=UPI001A327D6E|nr:2'-5' RNA ligase family protein [Clostridium perfringens]EGT5619004.1 hypothetical protein [Clostridium perfringens]MDT9336570.1 hypothetical protein [Clostridium perfringens]MDT9344326.1 hypothetical protein [Clostridium perfringens]MDT9347675.1 hypothetical protein [Clostridium perfringens]MDT9353519.1 hypothetical protein [Clostridium perfringens]
MKYYLVALFDEESCKSLESLQRGLLRKYKLPRNHISLHIPLETIDNPNLDKLDEVVLKLIKPYKKFKIELTGSAEFNESTNKALNLQIENKGYIKKIHRLFNDMLKLHGFNVRERVDSPLYIPINTPNFKENHKKNNTQPTIFNLRESSQKNILKISKIELWRFQNNKREIPVKSYDLRNY